MGNPIPTTKKRHPFNKKVINYSLCWITQIYEPIMDNLSTYKEPMTCIFYATPNTPKSYTIVGILDLSNGNNTIWKKNDLLGLKY